MTPIYIHKNKLELLSVEECDLWILQQLKHESWYGTHNITITNEYLQKEWFQSNSLSKDNFTFIIRDPNAKDDMNPKIGLYKISNIDWINRQYDSAHDVFIHARGKKYGKPVLEIGVDFGFEVLNMNRLNTEVLENNLASLKCAEYVGFQVEGRKRNCIYKCGDYLDSICMGIIKEDWINLDRVKNYDNICNISYQPKNDISN